MGKEDDESIVITAMVVAQVLHCVLDELEGTPYYKRNLKQTTKKFQDSITKECDHVIAKMYEADEASMVSLQEDITLIAKSLATMNPINILSIREFIEDLGRDEKDICPHCGSIAIINFGIAKKCSDCREII